MYGMRLIYGEKPLSSNQELVTWFPIEKALKDGTRYLGTNIDGDYRWFSWKLNGRGGEGWISDNNNYFDPSHFTNLRGPKFLVKISL